MEQIEGLIDEILQGYHQIWLPDIIDQVFVAIEKDPRRLKRYHEFADGDYGTTNQMIGCYVKESTGKKSPGESEKPKSTLTKTFTLLG
jgi:hypothetical protein